MTRTLMNIHDIDLEFLIEEAMARPGGLEAIKAALARVGIGTFEAKIHATEMCSYDCPAFNETWQSGCSLSLASEMDKPGPSCPATLRAQTEKGSEL